MIGAALFTGTGIALADGTDDAFLAQMHKLGFTWPAGEDSDIVSMGHQICADRTAGKPGLGSIFIATRVSRTQPGATALKILCRRSGMITHGWKLLLKKPKSCTLTPIPWHTRMLYTFITSN